MNETEGDGVGMTSYYSGDDGVTSQGVPPGVCSELVPVPGSCSIALLLYLALDECSASF